MLFPIAYFGSISYYQELCSSKRITFELHEHFPKQTFRNRMQIRDAQGLQHLTVPIERPSGSKTPTKDIRISYQQGWQQVHWRAIRTAYANAPFFEHYENELYHLIQEKTNFLIDKNEAILQFFNDHLHLELDWNWSSHYTPTLENDKRNEDYESLPMKGSYTQVLFNNTPFIPTVSLIDALMNEGPISRKLLL